MTITAVGLIMMMSTAKDLMILCAKYLEITSCQLKKEKDKFIVVFVLENTPKLIVQINNIVDHSNSIMSGRDMLTQHSLSQLVHHHTKMNRYLIKDIVDILMIIQEMGMIDNIIGMIDITLIIHVIEIIQIDHNNMGLKTRRIMETTIRDIQTGDKSDKLIQISSQVDEIRVIVITIITNSKRVDLTTRRTIIITGPIWTIDI